MLDLQVFNYGIAVGTALSLLTILMVPFWRPDRSGAERNAKRNRIDWRARR